MGSVGWQPNRRLTTKATHTSQSTITVEVSDGKGMEPKGNYVVSRTAGSMTWCSSFTPEEFAELKNLVNRF